MSLRFTHTTTYFTCRWLVAVLAIFLFTHVCIPAARAQELSEATQEPDGQAAVTEAAQEAERQAGATEATQEPGGQAVTIETTQEPDDLQTITESGLQTNPFRRHEAGTCAGGGQGAAAPHGPAAPELF